MKWGDIATLALAVLSPLAFSVLTWTATRFSRLMEARAQDERVRGALLRVDHAVSTVVRELQQVTVGELRAAAPDRKLGTNVPSMLQRAALWRVRQHLGVKGLAELAQVLRLDSDAVDRLIGTRIEAAVYEMKRTLKGFEAAGYDSARRVS